MSSPESLFKSNYSDCNDRGDCTQTSRDHRKTIAFMRRHLGEREEGETYEALIKPRSLKWNRSEMSSEICTEITLRTRSHLDFSVVKQWISN